MKLFLIVATGVSMLFSSFNIKPAGLAERPYGASLICKSGQTDCESYTYILPNGLQVVMRPGGFNYYKKKAGCFVWCTLENATNKPLYFNREEFAASSSQSLKYVSQPFVQTEDKKTMFPKLITYPSVFTVPANQSMDYVLSFYTDEKYKRREVEEIYKKETACFLHLSKQGTDTLFSFVARDSRLK